MVAFRAFFDESGVLGTDRVMAIAGLFGEAQVLAQLSDAWRRELQNEASGGKLEFFEADHARGRIGEFYGWPEEKRDQKVEALAIEPRRADPDCCRSTARRLQACLSWKPVAGSWQLRQRRRYK
jgi:hypothetical protein